MPSSSTIIVLPELITEVLSTLKVVFVASTIRMSSLLVLKSAPVPEERVTVLLERPVRDLLSLTGKEISDVVFKLTAPVLKTIDAFPAPFIVVLETELFATVTKPDEPSIVRISENPVFARTSKRKILSLVMLRTLAVPIAVSDAFLRVTVDPSRGTTPLVPMSRTFT